ncbi:MAG: TIR domain-containing protein [Verrucomicrobiae bacterium]|nr:TIR domain-containing protein [Verrucomicrobiae bacterium]
MEDPEKTAPDSPPKQSLFQRAADFLFGYDFFISYRWEDGRAYAVELQRKLQARGFSCFLDSEDYAKGDNWRLAGRRALKKTSRLILVGTPGALRSEPVANELRIFTGLGRRVVPIDIGGALSRPGRGGSDDGDLVSRFLDPDILRIPEPASALAEGPADEVLHQIRASFDLLRQDQKRVRWFAGATTVFAAVAAAAIGLFFLAENRRRLAEEKTREALENLAASHLESAKTSLQDGRVREALHRLWMAYRTAPADSWRKTNALRLIGGWIGHTGRVVLTRDFQEEIVLAPGAARAIAFAPESRGTASLIDPLTGEAMSPSLSIAPEDLGHRRFAFSPDGARIACASDANRLVVLDCATREILFDRRFDAPVHDFALRNRRELLVGFFDSRALARIDLATGKEIARFDAARGDGPFDIFRIAAVSADGARVLTISERRQGSLHDIESGALLPGYENTSDWIDATVIVAVSPDLEIIAGAHTESDGVSLIHRDGEVINLSEGGLVAFDPAHPHRGAIANAERVTVRNIAFPGDDPLAIEFVNEASVTALAFSPDGATLVVATADSTFHFWKIPPDLNGFPDPGSEPDVDFIAAPDKRGALRIRGKKGDLIGYGDTPPVDFDARNGFAEANPTGFTLSADREVILFKSVNTPGQGSPVAPFDLRTGQPRGPARLVLPFNSIECFLDPAGRRLVSIPDDEPTLRGWNLRTGAPFPDQTTALEIGAGQDYADLLARQSANGEIVALACGADLEIWEFSTDLDTPLTRRATLPPADGPSIVEIAVSPDGDRVARVTGDNATLWDRDGRFIADLADFPNGVRHAEFSPDGQWLAVAGGRNLFGFDTVTGARVFGPLRHPDTVERVVFNADRSALAAQYFEGEMGDLSMRVRLWDPRTGMTLAPPVTIPEGGSWFGFAARGDELVVLGRFGLEIRVPLDTLPDEPEPLRETLELLTGSHLRDDGGTPALRPHAAVAARQRAALAAGPPFAALAAFPDSAPLLPAATAPISAGTVPAPIGSPEPEPAPAAAPGALPAADPVRHFLERWIEAGNHRGPAPPGGAIAPPGQPRFFTDPALVDGVTHSLADLIESQAAFESQFPTREFTLIGHEVLATAPAGGALTVVAHQHALLVTAEGVEREIEFRDELQLVPASGGEGEGYRIAARRRIDTQSLH